jgi:hypothetical protein
MLRRPRTPEESIFRQIEEEDRVRPILKLLRASCPAYSPAPQFTPRTIHDAVADMERYGELGRMAGWRFENGMYRRVEE